jgi:catechol 2,3-dioxygenase-like lactoylglutathione lyase family enzyme
MIGHLDHLVLTTARESACIDFYRRVLGMQLGCHRPDPLRLRA